jgi:helicase
MKIIELSDDLPERVIRYYTRSKIDALYPPQEEAVRRGLFSGKNILVAVPTASGKTMIAELAMLHSVLNGGKAVYIVPLRALAKEKYETFSSFEEFGLRIGISTGDFNVRDEWLGKNDIIIVTSEKMDSLLRNGVSWVRRISVIIVDEIHLIDSASRGPTLEVVLARLMRLNPKAQVLALSATIKNSNELADWLGAESIQGGWRPVELREGVFFRDSIHFDGFEKEISNQKEDTISIVMDTIRNGGQCLIFDSTRRYTEKTGERVGIAIHDLIDRKDELDSMAMEIEDGTEICERLANCVRNGSAFHHAGLRSEERGIVEDGFRKNVIRVICSTPTLSFGLNLPARRVIIRNYRRYDVNAGYLPIPVLEYKQMCGRAGRPGLDPYGESVLIARDEGEFKWLMQNYVMGEVEEITSKLGTENALRMHLLSMVSAGLKTRSELMSFLGKTLYGFQYEAWNLDEIIEGALSFLKGEGMIVEEEPLHVTDLGRLVCRLYIDPLSAAIIMHGMDNLDEIGLLHLICKTPDMRVLYLRSKDYSWVEDFVLNNQNSFTDIPDPYDEVKYDFFLSSVKTAMLIYDWINEKDEIDMTKKFSVGPGDIRSITEIAEWLMHSLSEISNFLGVKNSSRELTRRIEYGVRSELLELLRIKGVGRVRARRLYDAGYKSIKALAFSDVNEIKMILGDKTAIKIMNEVRKFN